MSTLTFKPLFLHSWHWLAWALAKAGTTLWRMLQENALLILCARIAKLIRKFKRMEFWVVGCLILHTFILSLFKCSSPSSYWITLLQLFWRRLVDNLIWIRSFFNLKQWKSSVSTGQSMIKMQLDWFSSNTLTI